MYKYCENNPIIYEDPSGHSIKSVTGKFFKGVWDSGKDTVEGVVYVVKHPVKTAKGLGNVVMHPVKTGKSICSSVKKTVDEKIIKGSAEDRAYVGGYLAGEVGQAFLTGGAGKAVKSTKSTKVLKLGSRGKKATKVIDKSSDVGRLGTKGKKIFKTRGKTGKKATSRGSTNLLDKVKSSAGKGSKQGGKAASKAEVYVPKSAKGKTKPLNKQKVNGQDIPLPDPNAQGPHTVLGGKISSETGVVYRQSATFPEGTWPTANGYNVPWSEVHWGNHGDVLHHTNPHQHIFKYDFEQKFWKRQEPSKFH